MREQFVEQNFRADSLRIIEQANDICADYQQQGFNLTLRQLYYQFVSRDLIPNTDRSYKRLGSIINDARLAGRLDWSYIQDRGRNVNGSFAGWQDPARFIEGMMDAYYEALWEGQAYRPEVWVEKEALIDVIARGCSETRVPHFACKGYVSQSEMYSAAKRFQQRVRNNQIPVVIHLGDHDPSGLDMTRDIRERLSLMSWGHVEVRRIALNMDQIEQYEPPPNPAKLSDSRGEGYVEEFGYESWELDALDPTTLTDLIEAEIDTMINTETMNAVRTHEEENQEKLRRVSTHWDAVVDLLDEIEEE